MKIKFSIAVMAAATILTACTSDRQDAPDNGNTRLLLTGGINVQSRAFTPTQSTSIKERETVSVWVEEAGTGNWLYNANQLTATADNGFTGGTEMFFPQSGKNVNIYAMHGLFKNPVAGGDAFPAGGIEFEIATDQTVPNGDGYVQSDLLYASSVNVARNGNPTTEQLTFRHVLSKIEIAIKLGAGVPRLADTKAVSIVDVMDKGQFKPTSATIVENMSSGILYPGQAVCTDFTDVNVNYNEAIIVPQEMTGKKLKFILEDSGELTYTFPDITFESGKKYTYHITLNLTGLQVTSTISDWVATEVVEGDAEM